MIRQFDSYNDLWSHANEHGTCVACGAEVKPQMVFGQNQLLCNSCQVVYEEGIKAEDPKKLLLPETTWFEWFIDYFTTRPCGECGSSIRASDSDYLCQDCRISST